MAMDNVYHATKVNASKHEPLTVSDVALQLQREKWSFKK